MTDVAPQPESQGDVQTAMFSWHVEQGARMVDFAGWQMPIQYTSIVQEHEATRNNVTIFDVSHMGRLRFNGDGAATLLDRMLTRSVADMKVGQVRYSLMCNHDGVILDDVLVYHLETPSGTRYFLLVVNASNRDKIISWVTAQWPDEATVELCDRTLETSMIAIQGPNAIATVAPLLSTNVEGLPYFRAKVTNQMNKPCIVSRTGYTGEDGVELIIRQDQTAQILQNVLASGRQFGISPAGLGARDTLRLEAAMPLYGHELNEATNPLEAGLGFAISWTNANGKTRDFIGSEALTQIRNTGVQRQRVGLLMNGKRPAREDYAVFVEGQEVGVVTSGTYSPTLQQPIAMAYLPTSYATTGQQLEVDVRGKLIPATVCELPF
ncbi:MAG: glycine cleavage system aminomethyltransferase GcvT, partial [Planctomycetota bacterium]|nr:glycine cleavage system aminomethyltransferase GcvT [Planctomycetota bacterium]